MLPPLDVPTWTHSRCLVTLLTLFEKIGIAFCYFIALAPSIAACKNVKGFAEMNTKQLIKRGLKVTSTQECRKNDYVTPT